MKTLADFNREVLRPSLLLNIKRGALDNAIQSADCQDIIDGDPEIKQAVEERLKTIRIGTSGG